MCPLTLSLSKGVSGWAGVAACPLIWFDRLTMSGGKLSAHHERDWGMSGPNLVRSP